MTVKGTNKILVTGATGFIGSHCLSPLIKKGFQVYGVSSKDVRRMRPDIHWRRVDLLDSLQVKELIREVRPSHLLHLAWYLVPGKYSRAVENLAWIQSSIDLFRQFAESGGKRIAIAGTCFEYDWAYGFCSEFLTPRKPDTLYGICKVAISDILEKYAEDYGISSTCGKIFFIYGPREAQNRLVASVVISLLNNQLARCTHGRQMRDFLHVEDVADALVALLESGVEGPVNIASGVPVSIGDLVRLIGEKTGRKELIRLGAISLPKEEAPLVVADVGRLKKEVGWKPKYDLDDGLDQTIRWWKTELIEKSRDKSW